MNGAGLLPDKPPKKLVWSLGWRSGLIQLFFCNKRMQGVGFGWAMLPVLQRWSRNDQEFRLKADRHFAWYNGNPYLTAFSLGAAARMEAEGEGTATPGMKQRMMTISGALGDRLFWHHLRPVLLALAVILLWAIPLTETALTLILASLLFVFSLITWSFRFDGVRIGWKAGAEVPHRLSRLGLLHGTRFLGYIGALLAGMVAASSLLSATNQGPASLTIQPSYLAAVLAVMLLGRRGSPIWVVAAVLLVVILEMVFAGSSPS
jgi:mannose/fructose/N-acetylgalactosamine-specific phosphotransferase system component IID